MCRIDEKTNSEGETSIIPGSGVLPPPISIVAGGKQRKTTARHIVGGTTFPGTAHDEEDRA
jgi:hypothetical protein